jgi:5-formyltetrahydrofolate cyclo-ligase
MSTKNELRQLMKERLAAVTPAEREAKSLTACSKLLTCKEYQKCLTLAFFVSMPSEIDTRPMIKAALRDGKKVLVPRTDLASKTLHFYEIRDLTADLEPGTLGILEPIPSRARAASAAEADCVFVPGLVFSDDFHRVGFGAGLYDRFLSTLKPGVPRIGLGFSFQKMSSVPVEPHDVRLDFVLTD